MSKIYVWDVNRASTIQEPMRPTTQNIHMGNVRSIVCAYFKIFRRSRKLSGTLLLFCFSILMFSNNSSYTEIVTREELPQLYKDKYSNQLTMPPSESKTELQRVVENKVHFHIPDQLSDEMIRWINRNRSFCNKKFTGFDNLFAELNNVTINPSKNTNTRGGEDIYKVKNQPEAAEYLKLKKGFFKLRCTGSKFQKYSFKRKSANLEWINALSMEEAPSAKDNISSINTVVAVQRYEYANIYHTMTDWYNMFLMMIFFKLNPNEFIILWMDAHPKGSLDGVWEQLFAPVVQASLIQKQIHIRKMIWSINGYDSFLSERSRNSVPYIDEFSDFMLQRFKVRNTKEMNCKNLNIMFVFRHDYVAHPRNMGGTVRRKIGNEEELIDDCKIQFQGHNITGIQLDSLSFNQQLQMVASTDILIGMHGAGLTLSLFLPKHAALIELYPSYFPKSNNHFKSIARWRGLKYLQWQNKLKSNERENYNTYIPPSITRDLIVQSINKMCS